MNDLVTEPDVRRFTASDGYRLHFRHYPAQTSSPRGYLVALHGIQSHGGWYEYSCGRLSEAGYEVSFLDRRGSGLNEQDRGHAPHADRLVHDVVQFLADVRFRRHKNGSDAPVILLGISWGGKLAAVACARRRELVEALVLATPGICARVRPSRHQRWRLGLAEQWGLERKLVSIPLDDPALFTDDADWQSFIRDDPLSLRQATVSLLNAIVDLDDEVARAPERITCPALLLLAGRDRIIDNAGTRHWFERLASTSTEILEYPQARHTLEFEPNRIQIFDELISWLQQHAPR